MKDESKFRDVLANYQEIKPEDIEIGMHLRVTMNIYQKNGRKIRYVIVKQVDTEGTLIVNGYDQNYPDWLIKPYDKNKKFIFYKKIQKLYSGICLSCERDTDNRHPLCYTCFIMSRDMPLEPPILKRS
jgi:hypothetical protein